MKKIYLLLLSFLLLIPLTVYAKSYEIKECNLSLEFDSSWDVFTRDNLKGNKKLSDYNVTEQQMKEMLEENNKYVDAIKNLSEEYYLELLLSKGKNEEVENFSDLSDKEIQDEIEQNVKDVPSITDSGLFKVGEYKFIMLESYDSTNQINIRQYLTTVDSTSYVFMFQTNAELTSSQVNDIEEVMNSVKFNSSSSNLFLIIGIVVLVVAVIGVGVYFFLKKSKDKKNKQNNNVNNGYYNQYGNYNNYNGYYNSNNGYNNNYNGYNNNYNGYNNQNSNGYNNNGNNNYR